MTAIYLQILLRPGLVAVIAVDHDNIDQIEVLAIRRIRETYIRLKQVGCQLCRSLGEEKNRFSIDDSFLFGHRLFQTSSYLLDGYMEIIHQFLGVFAASEVSNY